MKKIKSHGQVTAAKFAAGTLKLLDLGWDVPLQPYMIGTWLTHDWKKIKAWALENDIAK
jgi:hypothetical protein